MIANDSCRRHAGQALIEFILVFPLLLLLILGIITGGLYINANITVEQAARLGSRGALLGDPLGSPQSTNDHTIYGLVDQQIVEGFALSDAHVTVSDSENTTISPPLITVTVQDDYTPLITIPGLMPPTVTLTQSYSVMAQTAPSPSPSPSPSS
jgi:Flp pilus assembly protein TadG